MLGKFEIYNKVTCSRNTGRWGLTEEGVDASVDQHQKDSEDVDAFVDQHQKDVDASVDQLQKDLSRVEITDIIVPQQEQKKEKKNEYA